MVGRVNCRPLPSAVYNLPMHACDLPDIVDSHLHIIDPGFPLVANDGYLPPPFRCEDYHKRVKALPVCGGVVVTGSFQGFDQGYLEAALTKLGEGFVGVTQLPSTASDDTVLALDRAGVRGIRFNLKRGGSEEVSQLDTMARRVYELAGWHTELYVDSAMLEPLLPCLSRLPAVSIDHLGLSRCGWRMLLTLVERGARVKASGFSRGDLDIATAVQQITAINPGALMFGSDLPCTRAPRDFGPGDIQLLYDALDSSLHKRVFAANAREFYRLRATSARP